MSTFDAKSYWRKKEEEKNGKKSTVFQVGNKYSPLASKEEDIPVSTSKTTTAKGFDAKAYWGQKEAQSSFGLNTLQSDLTSLSDTIGSVYNGWQSKETMNNTLSSVQSMYDRLGKYQEYQKKYGGTDLSEVLTSYKSVLDGWDDLSKTYGQYKDAESYTRETTKLGELGAMTSSDVQKKMDELEKNKESDEEYFNRRSKEEFDRLTKEGYSGPIGATADNIALRETKERPDINIAYTTVGGENITWKSLYDQKKQKEESDALYKKISSMDDFDKYKTEGANIKNPTYDEAERIGLQIRKTGSYPKGVGNKVEYSFENIDKYTDSYKYADGAMPENMMYYVEMTDQERELYNYHLGREQAGLAEKGTADNYLDSITGVLKDRYENKAISNTKKYADEHPVSASISSVLLNLGAGVEWASDSVNYLRTGELDDNFSAKSSSAIRSTVSQNVDWEIGNWDAFDFVYNTGMSMADSVTSMALLGGAGGVALGLSAAAQGTNDALERGLDNKSAFWSGISAGVFEGLFESVSIGKFKALKDAPVDSFKTLVKEVGKSMLVNASEETLTEIANILYDNIANADLSQAQTKIRAYVSAGMSEEEAIRKVAVEQGLQIAEAGASGALMGFGFGAIGGTSAYHTNKTTGKSIKANERVSEVFDIASNPEIASAYETYTRYANKGINSDNITDSQLGRLYSEARADAQSTLDSKKSTQEQRDSAQKIKDDLDVFGQYNPSARANKKTAKMLNDEESIKSLIDAGLESGENTESFKLATEYQAKLDSGKKLSTNEISKLVEANDKAFKDEDTKSVTERLVEEGESAELADIVTRKLRGETLTIEEGEKLFDSDIAQMIIAENSNAENVTEELMAKAKTMDKGNGALFIALYDGKTDIDEYATSFNLATTKAENNFTMGNILQYKGVLSNEQISKIYSEVQIKAEQKQTIEFKKLAEKTASIKSYKAVIDESAIDYNNTSAKGKVNWNDLTPRQRKAVTFIKGFAQATGMNLTFVANNPEYNGKYDRTSNTIYINLDKDGYDAITHIRESILPAMSHETTHWMEKKSPALYRRMNEIVFSTLQKYDGLEEHERIAKEITNAVAKEYKKQYEKENPGKSISLAKALKMVSKDVLDKALVDSKRIEVARSEIIARACEDMLSMSEQGKKMFNSLSESEQKTLGEKIKEFILLLKDWVSELLGLYKAGSYEAEAMRKYEEDLNELLKVWDMMLEDSVNVNQALEKSGAFGHKSSAEGDVLHDIKETLDGIQYVVLDKNIFLDKEGKELSPKQAYNALIGQKIILEDGDIITFVKRLPGRKDMYNELFRRYPAFKDEINIKAINEAINKNIVEVIETSKITKKNEPQRYSHLGVVDFDKRKVYVTDENVVYSLTLAIANLTDGKKVAYAKSFIENAPNEISEKIKKAEAVRKSRLNQLSNPIILNSDKNVKENISDKDSTGRELSKGQKEYFKESTVRDENGNLLVMYRGDSSEVTVFDRKKTKYSNLYGRGFYFTNSKAHAEQYGASREFYLDIKNPLLPKQNAITKEQMLKFLKAIENDGEDYDLYNYGEGATAESVLNSVWGKGDFEMLQDINAGAIGDLVAAVELFNEVNGTSYDGIVLPTETVTFNSEQAKLTSNLNPTKDEDIRFSMKENVEETKDLVAVHNLSPAKLLKTLKLGGLPMPSIAITRAREGYNNFGDISLVFNKDTIDPQFMRSNKVYSGDAWTPTYPQVAYKLNTKSQEQIKKRIDNLVPKNIQDDLGGLHLDSTNMEYDLNRHGDMVTSYRYNYPMKYAFLKDNGVNLELPTKEEPFYRYGEVSNSAVISFAHKMVDGLKSVNSLLEQHSSKLMADTELINSIATIFNEDAMSTVDENSEAYQKLVENPLFKPEDIDLSTVLGMLEAARKYFHSNGQTKSKIDYRNARGIIDDYFDSNSLEKDYEYWLNELFSDVIAKEGIRNNKDLFTPSGNRRSFEALHYEHNLENVIKVMKEQGDKGVGGFGGGNIFGASTREYGSIEDIKADAENRMESLPESKYDEMKKGFSDRLFELASSLPINKNSFSALDDAANMLIEAVLKFKTKSGMANYLRSESQGWANYNDYIVDDLIQLVSEIRQMPVAYFEAKPKRAVGLDEIKAVIMPTQESYEDDLSEVKSELEKYGIPIHEYEYGDNEARKKALNSLDDVLFSDKDTEYLELAKNPEKNEARLRELVYEAAKEAGYTDDSSWRMEHSAPNSRDDVSLDKLKESGLIPGDFWEHPEWYTYSAEERESYYKVKKAIETQEKRTSEGNPRDAYMWVYRAVDKTVNTKEDYFRNGDWVTPSKDYAINEGKMNPNGYRIIKHSVSIKHLYWDGNSIAELGYDDGNTYAYADTLNNRKLLDPVTYDDDGNVIPLSKRFKRRNWDVRYSEKDDTSVYELMGENERLKKENEKFKADFERLQERLKIERQITHGNYFNENQLGAVAGHLRNIAKSSYDKVTLMRNLKDVYSFIAQSSELTWEEVFEKCYRVAHNMLEESKPITMTDEYTKGILRDVRSTKISLSEAQKSEAKYIFGKNWNRNFFGRITITDNGVPLESIWQEWAGLYPDFFDADISDVNMPERLYDILNDLQDASEIVMQYNEEEQTRWLANEIYNQYWNVSNIKSTADKYDKKIKLLNFEHRKAMAEFRSAYEDRVEKQRLVDDMYYRRKMSEQKGKFNAELVAQRKEAQEKQRKLVKELRERKDEQIAIAKQHGRDMMDKYKDNAERKTRIQSITSNVMTLKEMLVKNSKDKHIPEVMKGPVKALIDAIDFSSKRLLEKGVPTQKDISLQNALRQISDMVVANNSALDGVTDLYGAGLDAEIIKMMKSVDRMVEGLNGKEFVLQLMSAEDLKTLDKMVKVVKASANKLNKFHVTQHNAGVEALGVATAKDVDDAKKIYKDHKKHFDKLKTKTYWNQLNPYYAFKNLGTHAMKIMQAFMDGQDKVAFLAQEVIDKAKEIYTDKEYKKWSETYFEFKIKQPSGKVSEFSMNVPQIMSLYCVSKQEDARRHLLYGMEEGENKGRGRGITLVETNETEAVRTNIQLTEADLNKILAKLNEVDRAKEVADKLQEYMGTRGAELGNEISMARWGIKSFGIENYFPIKVSDGAVPNKGETPGVQGNPLIALLNMSFTHARNQFASQSIEIGDVFDVFANHMSSMIQYNAMALPVLDMYKWMNCKVENDFGEEISVQTSIRNTFGDYAWGYFSTFLKDINGSTKNDTRDNLGTKFFKNAKVAKVAANIRVAFLQFTSYIRAGAVMDNKYLLKAIFHKPKIQKSMDHCGIALWKSLGYYETDITRPLTDKIKHAEDIRSKVINATLIGAEVADKVTWGYLWNACELEVRDTRKDLKVGSHEFNKEVGLRLREVVYRTQVVDSQLTRSQMMRSKSGWDKMLTTFASESTLSFNLITDLYVSYKLDARRMGKEAAKEKHQKYIRKAITAYVVTNVVTTLLASAFDAFRDYDEDDKDEEYITKLLLENFATNTSFINKIPYANLLISIVSGYSASRVETDWMESAVKGVKELVKYIAGEGSGEKAFKHLLKALSDSTGIAGYNLYRDVKAFLELLD